LFGIWYANLPNEFQADGALPTHDIDKPVCRVQFQFSTLELRSNPASAYGKQKCLSEIGTDHQFRNYNSASIMLN
jgi:hypothetical protein